MPMALNKHGIQLGSGLAQLAERSLSIPEVYRSNPVISKIL